MFLIVIIKVSANIYQGNEIHSIEADKRRMASSVPLRLLVVNDVIRKKNSCEREGNVIYA